MTELKTCHLCRIGGVGLDAILSDFNKCSKCNSDNIHGHSVYNICTNRYKLEIFCINCCNKIDCDARELLDVERYGSGFIYHDSLSHKTHVLINRWNEANDRT